jgi:hypothetical protein
LDPDLATIQKGAYHASGGVIEEDNEYLYYSFSCMHEAQSFFRYYNNKVKYNGQSHNGFPGALIYLWFTSEIDKEDSLYKYAHLFNSSTGLLYATYLDTGKFISLGNSDSDFINAIINSHYSITI